MELALFQREISDALILINKADSKLKAEIESLVSTIFLVNSLADVGATSPQFFGAIYLSRAKNEHRQHPLLFYIDSVVHESSHIYLNTMLEHAPLVLNPPDACFSSPLREDLRDMLGIYHAAFVLSRVIRVFKRINEKNLYPASNFVQQYVTTLCAQYEMSYSNIIKYGELTSLGEHIINTTRECAGL